MEDVYAETERLDQTRNQVRFQRAARDREGIGHDDIRGGRHAPRDTGDERAMPGVGRDRLRTVRSQGGQGIRVANDPGQPWVRCRVGQQPGIGHVDQYPGTAVALAHRGAGLDVVVHFLRFRGRAATRVACDGQDVIRHGDSPAELPVYIAERADHGGPLATRYLTERDKDHARDDTLEPVRLIPPQVGLSRLLQDLQHLPEVLLAHQELVLGVHVLDRAVGGDDNSDVGSSVVGRGKGIDDELNPIGDPGFQLVSPTAWFGHDALRKV